MFNSISGKAKKLGTAVICSGLMLASTGAFAADGAPVSGGGNAGLDLSPLTNSINFSSVLTGIMAVAGSLILLYAGTAGVKWILRMVKGA